MKAMLITGATGSLGSELVGRYHGTFELYAQGRDADKLLRLRAEYPGLHPVLGDLRSHGVTEALRRVQLVVHAAAQKYVDLAEKHCFYTVDTNVLATHDLALQAARAGVEKFIFISTDKASAPTNVYGISKYLAERLLLELADAFPQTAFVICRFGNIFGSNGSVVQLWLDAIRAGRTIQVTDPDMTRFMFSVTDAVQTVHFALEQGASGDIIIPKMRAVCLRDLLALFAPARVQITGPRPGEKKHETLYVRGQVQTGYQTDAYIVLNRRSRQPLELADLDSATAPRVGLDQLHNWLQHLHRRAA